MPQADKTKLKSVAFLPAFENEDDLRDTISRCAWYLDPLLDQIEKVRFQTRGEMTFGQSVPDRFDPAIDARIARLLEKAEFICEPASLGEHDQDEIARHFGVLILWKNIPQNSRSPKFSSLINSFEPKNAFHVLDPKTEKLEASFYLWMALMNFSGAGEALEASRARLNAFADRVGETQKCYLFGTGPSLQSIQDNNFNDGAAIVCNSLVKNKDLLRKLDPIAVAAVDPVFHAGCSRYAAEFRAHLAGVLDEFQCYFFVPLRDYHIHMSWLPETHRQRLIGVPMKRRETLNLNLKDDFVVRSTANVLTLMLLPLASTFFDDIVIAGCDGRPLEQNDYFWSFDSASQFDELMQNAREVHPAFFAMDYDDYYNEHCESVEAAIQEIERHNKSVRSLTPSYIPALAGRYEQG